MAHVLLGIGANLGDREAALQSVVDAMPGHFTGIHASRVYSTPPWGVTDQPAFLNAVIAADTEQSPMQVLAFARDCEERAQRVREVRWGPRTLDVDIIAYDALIQDDPELTLPHPRAHERAFVLAGVVDLDPTFAFPRHGSALQLLERADSAGIVAVGELRVPV